MAEPVVGHKIKRLRQVQGLTAKSLAEASGISVGMLSQLEKGSTQGSVETLRKIAKVLDTTLADLFTDDDAPSPLLHDHESFYVVRKDARKKISFPDPLYKCEMLTPDLQGDIEFVLVELEPGRTMNEALPHTRGGEECDFVLEGEIQVQVGERHFKLQTGDSIRFDPAIAHRIENKSDKKAVYISAITPPSF